MEFDLFCSLAQTPRAGLLPDHAVLLREFLDQAVLADRSGFGCVWVAESHFSLTTQKDHPSPVMSHWTGEMGLNTDICQLAAQVFARTERIEVGSAVMNIVAGGPVAAAERVAGFLAWHGLDPGETRRLNVGFASGRFDHVNRTFGIVPRNDAEASSWSLVKTALLQEAGEVFVRLLSGEAIGSADVTPPTLHLSSFPVAAAFDALRAVPGAAVDGEDDRVHVPHRWQFGRTRLVPDFRPELLGLYAGTHVPALQDHFNRFAPVRVFNLSITAPAVIEQTHERMATSYHWAGGPWRRPYMPRTVLVFVNADPLLSPRSQREAAHATADEVLRGYWAAMEGTIDPQRLAGSASNAVIGNPADVAEQLSTRFHRDERLMLWFDFFRPSGDAVLEEMAVFAEQVRPHLLDLIEQPARLDDRAGV
jgi:alkanesulfonate monooxygenase SsuD/methylene tetrahydromethanopterin reductase-like flavin-dependent oxidoreductase (luciferase family)